MYRKLASVPAIMISVLLVACGGDGNTILNPGGSGTGAPAPDNGEPSPDVTVASLQLFASSPQLPSDVEGKTTVTLTALVRDANNNVLDQVPVNFSAGSGALQLTQPFSDGSGAARAELSNGLGDPRNRAIQVTATAQSQSATVTVQVTGTTLSVSGPGALAQGDAGTYQVQLRDSQGAGIGGQAVDVVSANGNTLSSTSLTTGPGGNAQFDLTATVGGEDTLTVGALELEVTRTVKVSDDSFSFTEPATGAELPLNDPVPVTVEWTQAGVPQANQSIQFTSTRGTLSSSSSMTDGDGLATVQVSSSSAGPATITAVNPDGTSTSRSVTFVATEADKLLLQASPFTLSPDGQSTITATVRDPNGNLVKNKLVEFQLLNDPSNGSLSAATDITDGQGRARVTYTAGGSSTGDEDVLIRAFVADTPTVDDQVNLTVGGESLSISLGTGNTLFEPTSASFAKEWVILVSDVTGNARPNQNVQVSLQSLDYYKGELGVVGNSWTRVNFQQCANEDPLNTGDINDPTVNDENSNNVIEPGNIALVAAVPNDAPTQDPCSLAGTGGEVTNVTTNDQGQARVCVIYPQNFNLWLDVRITAKATVTGTESKRSQAFLLPAKAEDLSNVNASPPGVTSPFGADLDCSVPPPGT